MNTPDVNGYTPILHDPRHKRWISSGFCVRCGGYNCTTPRPEDVDRLRQRVCQKERELDALRRELRNAVAAAERSE